MTTLGKLYKALDTLREQGISTEELEQKVQARQEEIIKREILPDIREIVGKALAEVRNELILVVDFKPGEPVSVHLSRESGFVESLTGAKEIVLDNEVEHTTNNMLRERDIKRSPKSSFSVHFPDGTLIAEPKATDTLQKAVEKIGVDKVRRAVVENDIRLVKVPFVSNRRDTKYASAQRELGGGLFLMTHSSNNGKKRILEKLSALLGLGLSVEVRKPYTE